MANPNPKTDHLKPNQWKPGQSGNPGGMPKGANPWPAVLRKLAANPDEHGVGELANQFANLLVDMAVSGDGQKAWPAMQHLLDRLQGPVPKDLHVSGGDSPVKLVRGVDPDDL